MVFIKQVNNSDPGSATEVGGDNWDKLDQFFSDTVDIAIAQINSTIEVMASKFKIRDVTDETNEVNFDVSGITTGTTRTLTVPDASDTIVLLAETQTLTNKTLNDFSNLIAADEQHLQVRNESGGAITKGQAVYISGYSVGQDLPLVQLADANGADTYPVVGLVEDASISNNATGGIIISGRIAGIDTSAFTAGDIAYLSNTAGGISTRPTGATDAVQALGEVLRSHATLGVLELEGAGRTNDVPNLLDGSFWVGNATNTATPVAMSVGATMSNTGVVTIASVPAGALPATVVLNDQANTYTGAGLQDFAGATLDNVAVLQSNAATPATDGAIRFGKDDRIFWRNSGNTANHQIGFSGDVFTFFGASYDVAMSGTQFRNFATLKFTGTTAQSGHMMMANAMTLSWATVGATGVAGQLSFDANDEFKFSRWDGVPSDFPMFLTLDDDSQTPTATDVIGGIKFMSTDNHQV